MADECDIASEHEAKTLAAQIAAARVRRATGLIPSGACHYCDTQVRGDQLFCDGGCAGDYAVEQGRLSRRV